MKQVTEQDIQALQKEIDDLGLELTILQEQLKIVKTPKRIENPNLNELENLLDDYIKGVEKNGGMKDAKQWIYEEAVEAFFGNTIWTWINKYQTW